MSRTTQFVGLTGRAEGYVASRTLLASTRIAEGRTTEGTCGEPISLREWQSNGVIFPKEAIIREVVQAMPWSCGAMIFTCLEVEYPNGEKVQFHHWVPDPEVIGQFDRASGTYWV